VGPPAAAVASRHRPPGLFVLDHDAYDLIYGPAQRAAIDELVEIACGPLTAAGLGSRPEVLARTEVLLSGWGAPLMDGAFLDNAQHLRIVFYAGGAVRRFLTDEFFARGIRLSSTRAYNAVPVAEFTLAVLFFSLKHGWRFLRGPSGPADPARHAVPGTYRSTVGLISLGTIGRRVAELLRPHSLEVLAYDPYCTAKDARDLGVTLVGLEELFHRSAAVSVHTPLYDMTRGMITKALIASMPIGATFINTARGGLLDHDDLAQVLAERADLQAVLDVTEPEPLPTEHALRALPNVVITPHIAGSIGPECARLGDAVVAELRRYIAGEDLLDEVDARTLSIAAKE
jgi:phosphoglycerate dehydrogenase-like enzyme